MKNIIFAVICFTFLSCNNLEKNKVDVSLENKKNEINVFIDSWHKSASDANYDLYFNGMTTQSVFIGTDAYENWKIDEFKSFSKPYFDKGKAWSFTSLERNVYLNSNGDLGWFDELLDTHMGICRGSGVVVIDNGTWKIEHYVLSLTIPNDNVDRVTAINKKMDDEFKSSLKK